MVPYLSRIEGPPPKRNVARSNRAGIAIITEGFLVHQFRSVCIIIYSTDSLFHNNHPFDISCLPAELSYTDSDKKSTQLHLTGSADTSFFVQKAKNPHH